MIKRIFLLLFIFLSIIINAQLKNSQLKKTFNHIVTKGETLNSISNKFDVSIVDIINSQPDIHDFYKSNTNIYKALKINSSILIPIKVPQEELDEIVYKSANTYPQCFEGDGYYFQKAFLEDIKCLNFGSTATLTFIVERDGSLSNLKIKIDNKELQDIQIKDSIQSNNENDISNNNRCIVEIEKFIRLQKKWHPAILNKRTVRFDNYVSIYRPLKKTEQVYININAEKESSSKINTNISDSYIKPNSTQIDCLNQITQSTVRPSYYEYQIFILQEIPDATINEICRINNTSTNEIIKRNGSIIGYSIYQFSPKGKRLKDVTMDLNGKIMQKMIYQYDNNNEAKYLFKINYLDEIIFMKAKENSGFKDIEFNGPYPKTIENALRRYKSPERTYFTDPCNECRSKGYKFGQRCIICGGSGKVSHGIIKY